MASYEQFTRKLGKNGPQVTSIGLGLMGLSFAYGPLRPDPERLAFLDYAFENGERNFDSANSYGDSELLLGKWFEKSGKRKEIFLATKFALGGTFKDARTTQNTEHAPVDNSQEYIFSACDESLKRMGTDYIDLYYCHRLQGDRPVEEVVKDMATLQQQGKIKYIGLSEVSAQTLRRACKVVHVDAIQMEYGAFATDIEHNGVLEAARELGVAIVAYSPLGRGFLTGRYKSRKDFDPSDFRLPAPRFSEENFPVNLKLVDSLNEIATRKGVTAGQLALAWVLSQGDDIIPIPGTTSEKNFAENMAAVRIKITPEEDQVIREAIKKTEVAGARYAPRMQKYLFADTAPLQG